MPILLNLERFENNSHMRFDLTDRGMKLLVASYSIAVLVITLIPLGSNQVGINFIPIAVTVKWVVTTLNYGHGGFIRFHPLLNVAGNILLFMPLGYLLSSFMVKSTGLKVVVYAFLLSLSIECLQYIETLFGFGRTVDVDDVILNVFGAWLGYLVRHFSRATVT